MRAWTSFCLWPPSLPCRVAISPCLWSSFALLSLVGCASGAGPGADGGHGIEHDAGASADGGGRADGAPTDDGGAAGMDGGATDLGSSPVDAGSAHDLGVRVDLGPTDGGCAAGTMRACTTTCGTTGTAACAGGGFGACAPPAETCNGIDDDCNGAIDDGLVRACSTACGAGTEHCAMAAWVGCDAPPVLPEVCNGRDDNCDGNVDEGFAAVVFDPVPISAISAFQPACTGTASAVNVCLSAVKRYCVGRPEGCFVGGAGFLQYTATTARVVCFSGAASEQHATYADLDVRASQPVTDLNVANRVASSAVDRYCRGTGYGAGIGPNEWSGGNTELTCLPTGIGTYTPLPTSDLTALGCDPIADPSTYACNAAADSWCRSHGHLAGYGPTEWNTTDSGIVCIDTR